MNARGSRVWWICGILLLASTLNYMDRQTLSATADRIKYEFHLSNEQYGNLEWAFGWAFAAGASCFGFIADRSNIRWLYPAVLLAWSAMGFRTGWAETYLGLLVCRLFLGLFEAGSLALCTEDDAAVIAAGSPNAGQQRAAIRDGDRGDHHAADSEVHAHR